MKEVKEAIKEVMERSGKVAPVKSIKLKVKFNKVDKKKEEMAEKMK